MSAVEKTFADWISERAGEGALLPAAVVQQKYAEMDGAEPEIVTTRGASSRLGYGVKYWRRLAESGAIGGAYRENGGIWRLPLAECRRHLLVKQNRVKEGFKPRGPQKKTPARTQAA